MRLTLRTLLAYLNDTLEPAQAKEIGKKVNESEFAANLVDRIQEVVRKRRLMAPDLEGKNVGLGPNTVAEYLDNVLKPSDVTKVERFCLEQDLHLAELASVDQIRTLALCEPVTVHQSTRDRMYEHGPSVSEPVAPAAAIVERVPAGEETVETPAPVTRTEVPVIGSRREPEVVAAAAEYPKPSVLRKVLPYICFTILGGLWVYLMQDYFKSDPKDNSAVATNVAVEDDNSALENPVDKANLQADSKHGGSGPTTLDSNDSAVEVTLGNNDNGKAIPIGIDAPPPADDNPIVVETVVDPGNNVAADKADPATAVANSDAAMDKGSTDVPAVKPPGPDAVKPVEPEPAVDAEPVATNRPSIPGIDATSADAPELAHLEATGVLLGYDETESAWLTTKRGSFVKSWDRFAVPAPFRGRFEPIDSAFRIDVLGGTSAQYLGESKAAPFGLAIDQGQVVIMGDQATDFDADSKEVISISTHGLIWRIEILSANATCGIEVVPALANSFEKRPEGTGFKMNLYVAEGSVRVVDSAGEFVLGKKNDTIRLPITEANAEDADAEAATAIRSVPAWVTSEMPVMPSGTRRYATLFQKEFIPGRQVAEGVYPRVNDRRPQMADLATKCLSTIGDSEALVRALTESEHEEAREAAIDGLRSWLVADEENAETLKQHLGAFLHDRTREDVYRLLWGFNSEDGKDAEISRELVIWLDHEKVFIRQLAFKYIKEITGKTNQYGPSRPIGQRKKSYSNWLRLLEREGALLSE